MKSQRLTGIILFCFAIIIGFYNTIAGLPWVALFSIPFLFSIILHDGYAKIAEIAGMLIVSVGALIFMDFKIGLLFMLASFVLIKTITKNKFAIYGYVILSIIIVFTVDYIRVEETLSRITHAFVYSLLYLTMSICIHIYIDEAIKRADKTNLEKECMAILEKSLELNTESLKIINELQEDKNAYNS